MPKSIFKKKLMGYDPVDVTGYIEKINAQAANEIESAERSAGRLREEKEKLKKEIADLTEKINATEKLEDRIAELLQEKEKLCSEIEESKNALTEADERYAKLKADYDALSVRYDTASEKQRHNKQDRKQDHRNDPCKT